MTTLREVLTEARSAITLEAIFTVGCLLAAGWFAVVVLAVTR